MQSRTLSAKQFMRDKTWVVQMAKSCQVYMHVIWDLACVDHSFQKQTVTNIYMLNQTSHTTNQLSLTVEGQSLLSLAPSDAKLSKNYPWTIKVIQFPAMLV